MDYDRLRYGEHEFYTNVRTLHPEIEHPKKRLREFERVKLAEDDFDSDIEIIELEK